MFQKYCFSTGIFIMKETSVQHLKHMQSTEHTQYWIYICHVVFVHVNCICFFMCVVITQTGFSWKAQTHRLPFSSVDRYLTKISTILSCIQEFWPLLWLLSCAVNSVLLFWHCLQWDRDLFKVRNYHCLYCCTSRKAETKTLLHAHCIPFPGKKNNPQTVLVLYASEGVFTSWI